MNRGIVVKLGLTHAVVMNETMNVVNIRRKKGVAVGERIYYTETDIYSRLYGMVPVRMKYAAVLASLLMVIGLIQFSSVQENMFMPTVYAIVSVDINPSVEFEIDDSGRVIEAIPVNEDAIGLIDSTYQGMTVEQSLEQLMTRALAGGFLSGDGAIMLSLAEVEEVRQEGLSLNSRLQIFMEEQSEAYTFIYYKAGADEHEQARQKALSMGRAAINDAVSDETMNDNDLTEMSISSIMTMEDLREALIKDKDIHVYQKGKVLTVTEGTTEVTTAGRRTQPVTQSDQGQVNEYQEAHQEKDGGGGQNSDNGQQKRTEGSKQYTLNKPTEAGTGTNTTVTTTDSALDVTVNGSTWKQQGTEIRTTVAGDDDNQGITGSGTNGPGKTGAEGDAGKGCQGNGAANQN